jgi:hypothetical protein
MIDRSKKKQKNKKKPHVIAPTWFAPAMPALVASTHATLLAGSGAGAVEHVAASTNGSEPHD